MKRRMGWVLSVLTLMLVVLAGCGTAGQTTESGGGSQGTQANGGSAPKESTPAKRIIKHEQGETEVPGNPQKIAVIADNGYEDNLLAMGVKPYIASTFAWSEKKFYPHIADKLAGVQGIEGTAPNVEKVLELKPDVIIISGQNKNFYEQLSKIAPTVQVPFNEDWKATHRLLGEIVGRQKEAEQSLQDYEKKVAEAKAEIQKAAGSQSVLLAILNEKTIRVQGTTGHAVNDLLYKDLGLKPASGIPTDKQRVEVSLEGLSTFTPDVIFLQKNRFSTVEQAYENLKKNNVWNSLPAVKNGKVYDVDNWLAMSFGPIGRGMIVDQVKKSFTGK